MTQSDAGAHELLAAAIGSTDEYYKRRGLFQDRIGFGAKPALVVIDFAYGWTDESYAGGSRRLDAPVQNTRRLLEAVRTSSNKIPIIYTTRSWREERSDPLFKSAADDSPESRPWDERATTIDERLTPHPQDLLIEKENASAFFGTHLAGYLIRHHVDTLLITGCSTSACVHATAIDARSYGFRPIIVRECVGDRSTVAHVWTLFDVQARFADVRSVEETLSYVEALEV